MLSISSTVTTCECVSVHVDCGVLSIHMCDICHCMYFIPHMYLRISMLRDNGRYSILEACTETHPSDLRMCINSSLQRHVKSLWQTFNLISSVIVN